jgi:hypothetical protein
MGGFLYLVVDSWFFDYSLLAIASKIHRFIHIALTFHVKHVYMNFV